MKSHVTHVLVALTCLLEAASVAFSAEPAEVKPSDLKPIGLSPDVTNHFPPIVTSTCSRIT